MRTWLRNHLGKGQSEALALGPEWCVYSWRSGTVYKVYPATKQEALRELSMLDELDHEAMPIAEARRLRNAHSHGRLWAVEQIRQYRQDSR
jgi:hypothetical protein